ncbi:MAG: dihydroorotase family protein [Methanobacterium sp.]|nr:dihydroorotase family protein [Methanobacterium sp.]
MLDLCITNCKMNIGAEEVCLGIEDGKIFSIKKLPTAASETIDVQGMLVLPGLIDAHVHFRDPGLTVKEDFFTGSAAAAAGGYTTVLDMPNTIPPTNTPQAIMRKRSIALSKSLVDFGLHVGVVDPSHVRELAKYSPASFKIFMDLVDHDFLTEAFRKISDVDGNHLISIHAEDPQLVKQCTQKMKMEGSSPELYAMARPPLAETEAVKNAISLAKQFNQRIHFCHVSTPKSLKLIIQAKNNGLDVTGEITPHHLFLDSSYLKSYGNLAKTNPPLRDREHRLVVKNLPNIDIIGTDHAPHTIKEKNNDVWNAPPGVPGLETILPLMLTQLNKGKISLRDIKRLLCERPAKIFNIPKKGLIAEGMDADLVVVDLKKENIIDPDKFHSKAKYSPFKGFRVQGMPIMTLVRGNLVMENGEILKNQGKFVYQNTLSIENE